MTSANPQGFLPPNLQFVDPQTGIINQQWMYFLLSLFNRTGGANGIISTPVTASSASSDENVTAQNSYYLADATSNNITFNLPSASSASGITIAFKRADNSSNTVKITGNIDGNGDYFLNHQYDWVEVFSNGSNWFIISANNFSSTGGNSAENGQISRFASSNPVAPGNLYTIGVTKQGIERAYLGINKNSVTGNIPPNVVFLSSYSGNISIGRGDGSGNPANSDIFVASAGVGIGGQTAPAESLDVIGNAKTKGMSGNTFKWGNNTTSPASTPFVLPGTQPVVGGNTEFLGTPTKWALVNIAGIEYKIPAY